MDEEGIMTVAGDIGSRSGSAVTILMAPSTVHAF